MRPLRIYLGDLTYTTLSLATEAFPLNIGYVGAYCKRQFGDRAELTLFKYPDELDRAIREAPPDVLGLSNYPWNHALGLELFTMMHEVRPETLCIMGGSNIPHQPELQAEFMKTKPMVDMYVYLEGEIGFANILQKVLDIGGVGFDKTRLKEKPIPGCLLIDSQGQFVRGLVVPRMRALDEFPSPYLTGLLDKFFDGKLSPMMETNRGCPFSCTFCHEGHATYNKVNFFTMERVIAELEYIAQRIPPAIHNLMFCDPNFGMYQRDADICAHIAHIQARTGWPKDIFATTGKNEKDRIAKSLYQLKGTMQMWLSVQSMDDMVLNNIKRTNISLQDMMHIQSTLSANHLPTKSEIIMGLPGETYESHIKSIAKLVTAGVDSVTAYTLMLLNGTDMNTPTEREKWGFISKYRVLPRDFGTLSNGRNVIEVEEVAVGTKDLSYEEYVALRRFHLIISVAYNGKAFAALFKLFRQMKLEVFTLLKELLERIPEAPTSVQDIVANFERETREELWDSEENLRAFFRDDKNYHLLLSGELGANLLQKYVALSLTQAAEAWADYVCKVAQDIVARRTEDDRISALRKLNTISRYCTARVQNIFGADRLYTVPEEVLDYDVEAWVADTHGESIDQFRCEPPTRSRFLFTKEQYQTTEDYIGRFGRTHQGIGKVLTKMNIMNAWRKCVRVDRSAWALDQEQPEVYYALIDEQASGGVIARR